ncbi:MAG: PhoH family protein [Candidatus Paceibacterota bacterium]|jgi:PhoH-like ATPase
MEVIAMNGTVSNFRPQHHQKPIAALVVAPTTLFVLDTSVLLHDPTCVFRFQEHDVHVPLPVLEELDDCKTGHSELSRNAREVARILNTVVTGHEKGLGRGVSLEKASGGQATGRLYLHFEERTTRTLNRLLSSKDSADNKILKLAGSLRDAHRDRKVVVVTKDTLLRLKAIAVGLDSQDYLNDHMVADSDILRSGICVLPDDFWDTHKVDKTWNDHGQHFYKMSGPALEEVLINEALILKGQKGESLQATVRGIHDGIVTFGTIPDYLKERNAVWGVHARNREQCIALNLLMNPDINYVTMLGPAGTGKTLLALAAGLEQVLKTELYSAITVVKETMPVGRDQGYFPGDENEKLGPWLGAVWDNFEVLQANAKEKKIWNMAELPRMRLAMETKSLSTVRGRSFFQRFIFVDEAQNLTPHQAKTLVTRTGPRSKIIFSGNLAQIDTPYLTEGSSGLAYLVNRMKNYAHGGHVILKDCERSDLAEYANIAL